MNNIEYIEVEKLKPFENHPYKVKNDEKMDNLIESIREHGILSPIIARPIENNEYEIISGHRRLFAGKRAGLLKVPARLLKWTEILRLSLWLTVIFIEKIFCQAKKHSHIS